MKKATIFLVLSLAVLAGVAFAADVTGKWTGQVPGRGDNTFETTFVFKVEGDKLTGTVTGRGGERPISEGKITGETISFVVANPERGNQVYEGTIAGDEIKFTRKGGQGEPRPFTAKRAK
jgi:hypothetical protein